MFLPLLSLYGYTSNCNIKLNIQVSVCFCKEAGAHFLACPEKNLKIRGKIRKNSVRTPLCKISSTGEIEQRFRLN